MGVDGFHYKLWYISSPIDLIDLKFTGYTHRVMVNICTKI